MLVLSVFFFLLSLYLTTGSTQLFGEEMARQLVAITANPFIALFIGLLATAVLQSSSMTTTMIVVLVASGDLTLYHAVPMIMGANIGTSVTSTIVSLGHISNREEYRRAISAASLHAIFNIITVLILFTLEITTQWLSGVSDWISTSLTLHARGSFSGLFFFVRDVAAWIILHTGRNPYISLPLGLLGLFLSLQMLSWAVKYLIIGKTKAGMNRLLFRRPLVSLASGLLSTLAVQSSSITTSLIVPLVANRKISLDRAFPFVMGANIGTTSTAVLAGLFIEAPYTKAAFACAMAHVLLNLFGTLVLLPFPAVRHIPVRLAELLGELTLKNRLYGVACIVTVYFIVPFILIFAYQQL
ncbi:MAG: sodium:phosphate symporter [Bacteroidia bacterium]